MKVSIYQGKIYPSGLEGYLEWQVRHLDGTPANFSYKGEAGWDGEDLRICYGTVQVQDFKVDLYATQESTDFQNGYDMAMRQQRHRFPSKQSERFQDGWRSGWEQREQLRRSYFDGIG